MPTPADAKARLRAEMRARRAALSPQAAADAATAVRRRLVALPEVAEAGRVAAYRAVRGELDLAALVDGDRWAAFTLPRVRGPVLEFVARREGQSFAPGAFGIPEPVDGEVVALAEHDVVLVPLVAFDGSCHRLGQGGGFYDRALASLGTGSRPVAVGVAYWFQQVESVPREPWDVRLAAVVTDRGVIRAGDEAPS